VILTPTASSERIFRSHRIFRKIIISVTSLKDPNS
jgi:hypothetical protein